MTKWESELINGIILLRNMLIWKGLVSVWGARAVWWLINSAYPFINRSPRLGYWIWPPRKPLGTQQNTWIWFRSTLINCSKWGMLMSRMLNRKTAAIDLSAIMDPLKLWWKVRSPSPASPWHCRQFEETHRALEPTHGVRFKESLGYL